MSMGVRRVGRRTTWIHKLVQLELSQEKICKVGSDYKTLVFTILAIYINLIVFQQTISRLSYWVELSV